METAFCRPSIIRLEIPMKILFCTQCAPSKELGGSKVALEIAEAMRPHGWECEVRAIPDIHEQQLKATGRMQTFWESFRQFLREHAADYDVVDYDHLHLPYPREEFCPSTLLVARSVLLLEHLPHIRLRQGQNLRERVRRLVFGSRDHRAEQRLIEAARLTLSQADLINVPNDDDRDRLQKIGMSADKIVVIPFGIWRKKWPSPAERPDDSNPPTMVFLGTFDYRKGCLDLVDIATSVFSQVPRSRLKLLGTAGTFQTEKQVRSFFPRSFHERIEIIPRFRENDLPSLLRGTTLGVFPSYHEGFGMAVVEMVASGIPVLAYRTPGPSSILPAPCLIARGDVGQFAQSAIQLLKDADHRNRLARECGLSCENFEWGKIGQTTSEVYLEALKKLRAARD